MGEALFPFQSSLPESREESLTRQFYDWEKRGRGWSVYSYPVELEPPFRPMIILNPRADHITDDARIPTFFSRIFSSREPPKPRTSPNDVEYLERLAEFDEPVVCDYYDEEFHELQIILPKDIKVTKSVSDRLLLSATYCSNPISFELIGTTDQVLFQLAATDRDIHQLEQQLSAYLPEADIRRTNGNTLCGAWGSQFGETLIVDFGLSNEFIIPLNMLSHLDADPLISIVGALSHLWESEIGIFQILFQKARNDWATEILDSVRFLDGTPFFSNAPEMIPHAKQKIASSIYASVIRVAVKSDDRHRAMQIVRSLGSGLSLLSHPTGNELIPLSNDGYYDEYHEIGLLRRQSFRCGMLLNLDELVSLVHPPTAAVRSEKLVREVELTTKAPPSLVTGHRLVLGENVHGDDRTSVSLSNEQRTRHMHLIGSSGSGKSTLMLNLIKQDLDHGHGVCVIDPHGDLVDSVIKSIPENRVDDVVLFDPSDSEFPVGFNILQARSPLEKTILSSDLVATFRRMATSWGDVMDSVLANAVLGFIESTRGGTMFDLKRFLVEKDFREKFLETVGDETIRYFWEQEFPLIAGKPQASILIRLDAFLRQSLIRNIVCQKENKLDFRSIMDDSKILLVKLSQGLIGEENAYLLGTMIVSRLYQSALGRQDTSNRPYFWLYLDEFHHLITPSMERILSGTRKYNLGLILAHQEFRQMQARSQEVASSVLSNCYTRICFRLGDNDADKFASGFSFFDAKSLQNLGVGEAIARVERADFDFNLSVSQAAGVSSEVAEKRIRSVVDHSRARYAKERLTVEKELTFIRDRAKAAATKPPAQKPPKPEFKTADGQEAPITSEDNKQRPAKTEASSEHRYLQKIIKRVGEDCGFIATIEKPVFGGAGKIDVALEREDIRLACEVAGTNTTEYEVQNIQKCLTSGFDRVIVLSSDEKHLSRIRNRAELILSPVNFAKVSFVEPEEFHSFLQTLVPMTPSASEREKIKGYTVSTSFREVSHDEREARKNVILEILTRTWRRKKKEDNE
jgi:hypothetical protein